MKRKSANFKINVISCVPSYEIKIRNLREFLEQTLRCNLVSAEIELGRKFTNHLSEIRSYKNAEESDGMVSIERLYELIYPNGGRMDITVQSQILISARLTKW